jgi:Tat protein secretion system quality control protein TatD with DNase activity
LSLTHPGNIQLVYGSMARLLGLSNDELAERMRDNFTNLFGGLGELRLS